MSLIFRAFAGTALACVAATAAIGAPAVQAATKPSVVATYRVADVVNNIAAGYGWAVWTVETRGVTKLVIRNAQGSLRTVDLHAVTPTGFSVRGIDVVRGQSAGETSAKVMIVVDFYNALATFTRVGIDPATGRQSSEPWVAATHPYNEPNETAGIEDQRLITTAGSVRLYGGATQNAPLSAYPTSCQVWSSEPGSEARTELPAIADCDYVTAVQVRGHHLAVTGDAPSIVANSATGESAGSIVHVIDLDQPASGWVSLGESASGKGGGSSYVSGPVFTPHGAIDLLVSNNTDYSGSTLLRPRTPSQLRLWNPAVGPYAPSPRNIVDSARTARLLKIADTGTRIVAISETPIKRRGHPQHWIRRIELLPSAWR